MRKTIDRAKLIDAANRIFRADEAAYPRLNKSYREGIQVFVSSLLMEHKSYNGFNYLEADDLDNPAEKPGIRWVDGDPDFSDTDNSRIFFYK